MASSSSLDNNSPSLFFRKNDTDDGSSSSTYSPTTALFLLLGSVPLFLLAPNWLWGFTSLLAALVLALGNAIQQINDEDKHSLRYDVLDAESVVQEMVDWERLLLQQLDDDNFNDDNNNKNDNSNDRRKGRLVVKVGLDALAKKYGKALARRKTINLINANKNDDNNDTNSDDHQSAGRSTAAGQRRQEEEDQDLDDPELALWCQRAAYVGLRCFGNEDDDDAIVAASVSLLALVAKNERVKERHLQAADEFGLDLPIGALQRALERAQDVRDRDDDGDNDSGQKQTPTAHQRKREQQCAELQRKGCLLLGALASSSSTTNNNNTDSLAQEMAVQVVQEGGLEVILNAVDWYRCHADVANWGLWAVFTLCYENYTNKVALVAAHGIPIVLQALRNCPTSAEVNRHGVAILFDLMRDEDAENDENGGDNQYRPADARLDVWKIRASALEAGLHQILTTALDTFSGEMDIVMMGQEILIGTGYRGDVPQFDPLRSSSSNRNR